MSTTPVHENATTNVYTQLRKWQTRIISLHPGDNNEPLVSDLLVVDLIATEGLGVVETDTIIDYDAVSYNWGEPNFDETLKCNGNEVRISSHLASGLRQFRQASSSRYLWVDAVCINQLDEPEKGRQVRNMLKIFEKARQVVAWLGGLDLGFTPFRECRGCHKCLCAQSSEEDSNHDSHGMPLSKRRKLMAVGDDGGGRTGDMSNLQTQEQMHRRQPLYHEQDSIKAFISRPWFSRTWVRQEVFAARDIVLQLGQYQSRLDDLLERIGSFCKAGDEHPVFFLVNHSPQNSDLNPHLLHLVGHLAASQKDMVTRQDEHAEEDENRDLATLGTIQFSFATHLLSTLQTAAHFDVSDSRDRVYGALGMMFHPHFKTRVDKSQWDRRFPATLEATYPIDYRKLISEVYQDVIKTAVHDSGTLDVLFVAQDRTDWACDLPSWVVDWRRVIPRMISRANWRNYTWWEAGNPSAVFEKDILHIRGVRRGVMETLLEPQPVKGQDSHDHDYTDLEDCFLRNNVVDQRVTQADLERKCSYVLRWIRCGFDGTSSTDSARGEPIVEPVLVSSLAKQGDWAVSLCDLDISSTATSSLYCDRSIADLGTSHVKGQQSSSTNAMTSFPGLLDITMKRVHPRGTNQKRNSSAFRWFNPSHKGRAALSTKFPKRSV